MFNIILGIYIIVAIVVIAGGSIKFYSSSQLIVALLFFIGSLISFVIFGKKWFDSSNSIFSKTPVSWPPTINTCPDYLVYLPQKLKDGSTEDACVDLIGVSRNGALKIYTQGSNNYFSLKTNSSDSEQKKKELCDRAIQNGLTWEGITNGESCTIGSSGSSTISNSSSPSSSSGSCSN